MTLETGTVYFFEQGMAEIPEAVSLFGFPVSFYGICMVLAAVTGVSVALREARKRKLERELTLTLLWITILSALLGARIYYAVFQWHPFSESPLLAFDFRSGGLAYFGALFGVWPAAKWYCRRKAAEFEKAADVLCAGAAAAAVPVWLGCAFMREPVGRFSEGICSVRIGTEYLPREAESTLLKELLSKAYIINDEVCISMHPVALYGVLSAVLILLILWLTKRFRKQDGDLFQMYLFLNALSCLCLEPFRASRCRIWGTEIPINSLVAIVILLVLAVVEIRYRLRQRRRKRG